jgi:hypothetical protein
MIIRYTKQKDHIPKGRLVEVTAEKGKEEIEDGFAEAAELQDYRAYQERRKSNVVEAEERESIRDMYLEVFGKEAPKSWTSEKIAKELYKKEDEALSERIKIEVEKLTNK